MENLSFSNKLGLRIADLRCDSCLTRSRSWRCSGAARLRGYRAAAFIFSLACLFYLFVFWVPVREISEALCVCEAAFTLHPMNETTHSSTHKHPHVCTYTQAPTCVHTHRCPPVRFCSPQPSCCLPHCTSPHTLLYIKHPHSWSDFGNQALIMTENPVHCAKETGMSPCVRLKMAFENTEAPVVANWVTVCLIVRLLCVPTTS